MRHNILRVLVAAIAILALALLWLWFDPRGKPRNVHWQAPEPHKPDFASMIPPLPQQDPADLNRFVSILERPLFSPSRRPPPPPPPPPVVAPPPPPDPLASIHLFGTFSGAEDSGGGIIARIDGKPKRVYVNENIGSWVVKSVSNRSVTLTSGAQTRTLTLVHARAPAPAAPAPAAARAPNANAAASAEAAPVAPPVPVAATPPPPATPQSSDLGERVRERKARVNAQRAQSGLPPIP